MNRVWLTRVAPAVVLLTAFLCLEPTATFAAAQLWGAAQVTAGAHDHRSPEVSDGRIVWLARVGTPWQVFTQKLGSSAARVQLTKDSLDHHSAQVSGDRVYWSAYRYDSRLGDSLNWIYTQKMVVDAKPVAQVFAYEGIGPWSVSGDRIVFVTHEGSVGLLQTKNIAQEVGVFLGDGEYQAVKVSGERVVWLNHRQVYTRRVGIDATETQLTTGYPGSSDPQVCGDRIVWTSWDAAFHRQVFTQKIGLDATPTQLTTAERDHFAPQVSGDRVVWCGYDENGYSQVFTQLMGADSSAIQLTADWHQHTAPQVSGNRIVWQVFNMPADPSSRIFTQKLGSDVSPLQLTSDGHYHNAPRVSGDTITWEAYDGAHWQVFRAKPLTTPTISRGPTARTVTHRRKHGVARYTLSATVRDRDQTLVVGKLVLLQTSTNGHTNWKNSQRLTTNELGRVSRSFVVRSRMSRYYRWYVPAGAGYARARTATQRILVR